MASPKELVAEVARQTGVQEGSVVQHDRNLSLANLRSVGGRGRAVARVTFQDAANLIIAVAGSQNVKDSVKTVRAYTALAAARPMKFGDIIRGETFGDALAALLEAVPADRPAFAGPDGDQILVSLYGPDPRAVIRFKRKSGRKLLEYPYESASRESGKPAAQLPP